MCRTGPSFTLRGFHIDHRMDRICDHMTFFQEKFPMNIFVRRALKSLAWILLTPALLLAQPQPAPARIAMIESLSGPFANTGEAVFRNLYWAVERVNARGGVKLPASAGGSRLLTLERYDSKGQNEEALSALRRD
jgi:branched-chain amino acid transport system substrate-binding protein